MAALAVVLFLVWMAIAFGLRTLQHRRRTGTTGFHGVSGRPGSVEWVAGVLFVFALVAGIAAPLADLVELLEPAEALDRAAVAGLGVVLALAGIVATVVAQQAMGDSWRIGVEPGERTALVGDGPFSLVRNPIFSAMVLASAGLALMVPNLLAILGVVALVVGLELQVRRIEEPYLLGAHGASYARYAAVVGRFVPGVGRVSDAGRTVRP